MAKVNTKIIVDSFSATRLIPPPIPTLRIEHVDKGYQLKKTDGLPDQPQIHPFSEAFITPVGQQIISSTTTPNAPVKDKGTGILFGRINLEKSLKKKEGWHLSLLSSRNDL
ncbi:unnamed protein product [Lactuca virosa]|uniref:Uncharacterized protein n=1 Tax=Lactuca virosa TaxID=75947 RepID=A0AAU9N0Q9_9ASTR|nr:unnamed protein product [Lactuca virosa]